MILLHNIRTRLIEAIKQSGVKQLDLANMVGVSHQAISQYLSGQSMPALDTFAKLCAVLDLDANEILCVGEYEK